MTVYRCAWETGTVPIQHAADYATESAAQVRARTLKEAGISRVVVFAVRVEGEM